jgi:thiamine kinase-like enzyme
VSALELSDELMEKVDTLCGRERHVVELAGGLTNRNYKVTTPEGSYVVRLSSNESSLLSVDRDNEYRNSVIAASTGVGAPVEAYFPEDMALVIGFIDGPTFSDDSFAGPGVLIRVAAALRKLHGGPAFVNDFNMFDIQRGYLDLVLERGFRIPDDYLEHLAQVDRIRRALVARDEGTVACNNDLLAGNFIDDGEQIRLIDYEYSGNNDACFELGNIWSECHLSREQLEELVEAYYGRHRGSRLARARLQGLMSQYGWTLWASIQDATSEIDFDFWGWGLEKYERAVATFRGSELDGLLEQAQQDD